MALLPEVNFQQIRGKAPSGSRRDGFEELCNQLMVYGGLVQWPAGTSFATFGNPDGGREGRGELPNGEVWGWQAKYLFELDNDEFTQITKSVRRALSTEPKLARYYILLPYNRPAGDTEVALKGGGARTTKSAWTKWNEHVTEWEAAASSSGQAVTFEYIGETQLIECLLKPSQVGRLRYWFDLDGFSPERFREISDRAEKDAAGRYDPRLNVDLPIAKVFGGLARTTSFEREIRTKLAGLREARGAYGLSLPEGHEDTFRPAIERLGNRLDQLEEKLGEAVRQVRQPIGSLPDIGSLVAATRDPVDELSLLLRRHCLQDRYYHGNAASLYGQLQNIRSATRELEELIASRAWLSFDCPAILITGTGGAGKTHLLCDLAKDRSSANLPTLIALGEQFERGPIEADLGRIIGFNNPADQLLATFDAACQTAGEVGLVIIDGLNEAADRRLWNKYLGSFLSQVERFPHVRLVLSCRNEFLPDTLSANLQDHLLPIEHTGFSEVPRSAVSQFLDWYGIERPSFPMLDPEFTNPLFLKLVCTTLQERGDSRFPREGIGTTWIYDSFLDAINLRLASADRCDYDPRRGLVRRAVERIAGSIDPGARRLPREDAEAITSTFLPVGGWSGSLLNGLLKEAILSELIVDGRDYIRFGYERLGEIALAKLIATRDLAEVRVEAAKLAERWYANPGVLQALASVLPETHGVELADLLEIPPSEYHYAAHSDFLLSLAWRQPLAISDRTVEILLQLKTNPDFADAAYNALIQVAAVPGHKLNAEWLHQHLVGQTLTERDVSWSYFCDRQEEDEGHLLILIEWAWSDAGTHATVDTRYLGALTLSWALASSHRPTRDNATKAIIALLETTPDIYGKILRMFLDVDDDYVQERLLAIGCGIAQRSLRPDVIAAVAEAVLDFTLKRDYWPENYLSRDYTRRTIEAALSNGWRSEIGDIATRVKPPYTSNWSEKSRSKEEIESLSGPPDYRYSALSHPVMSDFDDFRKYVIDSAVRNFDLKKELDADHVGRLIFDAALELGWTPELFGEIDRNRPRYASGDNRKHEGYAQKYVWIAFRELIGRMTDRYDLNPNYRDDDRSEYQGPLDVYGHDIDPTMILQRAESRVYEDTPRTWFAPIDVTFPAHLDVNWANNDEHSPQVNLLLAPADASGQVWLVLEGSYQWSQAQHPEDAVVRQPQHRTWAQIRSYLLETEDIEQWSQWAVGQDWYGRWMPESGNPLGLLLADHPYRGDWPQTEGPEGGHSHRPLPPGKLVLTTTRYGGVANDWDHSASRQLHTFMPSTSFCSLLGLERVGDFQWGSNGKLLAESFAARQAGPDTVHVSADALASALREQGRYLLWTILAEKETVTAGHERPADGEPIFRTYSASYLHDGVSVRLLDASARTLYAAGGQSDASNWSLPREIAI